MRTFLVSLGCTIIVACVGCNGTQAPPKPRETRPSEPVVSATPSAPVKPATPVAIDPSRFFGAARGCFTLREIGGGETFEMGGEECAERTLPASTFKIPNAIIALDSGVLKDEKVVFKWDGVKRWMDDWNRDHALPTSMWYSVVPFYQRIAKEVGTERYRKYLSSFHYGNEDPSGDVTMFWLNNTLRISPREEVAFLTTMYEGKLPVSPRSVDLVKKILELRGEAKEHVRKRLPFVDQIPENVVLSGKTGSSTPDSPQAPTDVVGWFVGSVEREGKRWVFACRMRSNDEKNTGPAAAKIAYDILHERGIL